MPKVAEIKDAFVCYRSYIEAIRLLPEDKRWGFFDGIIRYALDEVEPTFYGPGRGIVTPKKTNNDQWHQRLNQSITPKIM